MRYTRACLDHPRTAAHLVTFFRESLTQYSFSEEVLCAYSCPCPQIASICFPTTLCGFPVKYLLNLFGLNIGVFLFRFLCFDLSMEVLFLLVGLCRFFLFFSIKNELWLTSCRNNNKLYRRFSGKILF